MEQSVAHKYLLLGISAAIGLTIFLFNFEWAVITGIEEDVATIQQDVGYIKGVIASWDENYPQNP